jgi:hypothetical protein
LWFLVGHIFYRNNMFRYRLGGGIIYVTMLTCYDYKYFFVNCDYNNIFINVFECYTYHGFVVSSYLSCWIHIILCIQDSYLLICNLQALSLLAASLTSKFTLTSGLEEFFNEQNQDSNLTSKCVQTSRLDKVAKKPKLEDWVIIQLQFHFNLSFEQ